MSSSRSITEKGDSVAVILPGFRFNPTDEELVGYYLKRKIQGKNSEFCQLIPEIELFQHDPGDLPPFFFTVLDRKSINSDSYKRATDQGYYKKQGRARKIKAQSTKAVFGTKTFLTYYRGRGPIAEKTDYVIHEYRSTETEPNQQRELVLCCLKNKNKQRLELLEDLDSPSPPLEAPQLGNVPDAYNDECSNWQPPMVDNNRPTNCGKEPVSNFAYGAPDEKAEENLGSSFHPIFQLEDSTLESPNFWSELGDISHANNYIGCNWSELLHTEVKFAGIKKHQQQQMVKLLSGTLLFFEGDESRQSKDVFSQKQLTEDDRTTSISTLIHSCLTHGRCFEKNPKAEQYQQNKVTEAAAHCVAVHTFESGMQRAAL